MRLGARRLEPRQHQGADRRSADQSGHEGREQAGDEDADSAGSWPGADGVAEAYSYWTRDASPVLRSEDGTQAVLLA
ncbi:hypothetical protein, partial [Marinitenerispora sediminis]|uniref:hypothetical protein n=1 Tax=Marinitenerispora sediminis TaxID=1931232 RepID=UPI001C6A5C63